MKKLIIILSGILLIIFITLTAIDWKGTYDAERQLWGLNRELVKISGNKEATPDYVIEQLANKYRAFIKDYPRSSNTMTAQLVMGNLYLFKKNYVKAREEFQKALTIYPKDKDLMAQAKVAIAKTYEIDNNWVKAYPYYQDAMANYPLTETGFSVPEYLARRYKSLGLNDEANSAYEKAVVFYKKIASDNPKTVYETSALKMIIVCKLSQSRWKEASEEMFNLMMKNPTGQILGECLKGINELCLIKIRNYDETIGYYKAFLAKYPKHPVIPTLKKMIAGLETLKEKNIKVSAKDPQPAAP